MFQQTKDFIKESKPTQYILILILGAVIGALFYPTKRIEERERQHYEEQLSVEKSNHSSELAQLNEKVTVAKQETLSIKMESEHKISSLTSEIKTLKSRQKTSSFKIVRPDGTIEERQFSETEIDQSSQVVTQIQEEFKQKVEAIETKWENIHKERVSSIKKDYASKEETYQKKIFDLEKSKITEINKKSFGLEAGVLLNKNIYGHATYDVLGPIFLGLHTELGVSTATGAGVGIRF